MNEQILINIYQELKENKKKQNEILFLINTFVPQYIQFSNLYNQYNVSRQTASNFLMSYNPCEIIKKNGRIYIPREIAFDFIRRYQNERSN